MYHAHPQNTVSTDRHAPLPYVLGFKPNHKPTSHKNLTYFSNISVRHFAAPTNTPTGQQIVRTRESIIEYFRSTMFKYLNQNNFLRKEFQQ